jgi:protein FrlC
MKLAYHTYAFGGRGWLPSWTLEEAIRLTAEIGFAGLELAACRPHGWPSDLSARRRRDIRQMAGEFGLAVSAICFNLVNHNIASPIAEEREGALAYGIECLDLAADLDCRLVTIGGGWSVRPHPRIEAWNWASELLADLAREAEGRGVALALENINSQRADVVVSTEDVARMIAELGCAGLQPMIDFYHLHLEGEAPLAAVARFGSGLAHVHFLDARRKDRSRQVPGEGELPLVDILQALQSFGYDGWLTAELWGSDPLAIGRRTTAFFATVKLPAD